LARALRAQHSAVVAVIGAASADRLLGVDEAQELASSLAVTTDDGSAGARGLVTDVLAAAIEAAQARVVYACGPMAMLAAVSVIAAEHGIRAEVAVEESMACGIGVCMTCVLPVIGADGGSRFVRSCVDGPVFDGALVRWRDVGTLPADLVGAAAMAAH
jgi:dihydroorotate dehydrogenase electron transfer subunit